MKRATLRELKQYRETAKRRVAEFRKSYRDTQAEGALVLTYLREAKAMLRNIQQAIKRREKGKRS